MLPRDMVIRWDREDFAAARRQRDESSEVLSSPIRQSHELRWRGPRQWRYGTTYQPTSTGVEYVDQAMTDKVAWQLSSIQLDVLDPKSLPPHINIAAEEPGFAAAIGLMLSGGLNFVNTYSLEIGEFNFDGRVWRVVGTNADYGLVIEFRGRWSEEDQRGFIESVRSLKDPAGGGLAYILEDYRYEEVLGRYVASSVTVMDGGVIDSRFVFGSAQPEPPERFDEITRVPDVAGSDSVRGPITVARLNDYREGNEAHSLVRETSGEWRQIALPAAPGPGNGGPVLRWFGIVASITIISAVVILRLRRVADAG